MNRQQSPSDSDVPRADDGRLQVELSGPEAFGVTATMGKQPYSMDWIPPID